MVQRKRAHPAAVKIILVVALLAALWHVPGMAQGPGGAGVQTGSAALLTELQALYESPVSDETKAKIEQYFSARLKAETQALGRNNRAVKQAVWSTEVAFWVAHVVLVLGLLAAFSEFVHATAVRMRGSKTEAIEVSVQLESMALRSTSMGVIVAVMSLGLYLAYLRFVLPLQVL